MSHKKEEIIQCNGVWVHMKGECSNITYCLSTDVRSWTVKGTTEPPAQTDRTTTVQSNASVDTLYMYSTSIRAHNLTCVHTHISTTTAWYKCSPETCAMWKKWNIPSLCIMLRFVSNSLMGTEAGAVNLNTYSTSLIVRTEWTGTATSRSSTVKERASFRSDCSCVELWERYARSHVWHWKLNLLVIKSYLWTPYTTGHMCACTCGLCMCACAVPVTSRYLYPAQQCTGDSLHLRVLGIHLRLVSFYQS